jgi:hypothetical protein
MNKDKLFLSIYRWLLTIPSEQEVEKYVLGLPDNERDLASEAADWIMDLLVRDKQTYFDSIACSYFYKKLPENIQLNDIESFISTSPEDMVHSLIELGCPDPSHLVIPSDLNDWSKKYVQHWRSTCVLKSYNEFINQEILLHSIIYTVKDSEESLKIQNQLDRILKRDLGYIRIGQIPNTNELDSDRIFFHSLSYFPDVYIDQILDLDFDTVKIKLIQNLFSLYQFVDNYGVFRAKREERRLKEILKGRIFYDTEADYLSYYEGLRLYNFENAGESDSKVLARLYSLWTSDNILDGAAFQTTSNYLINLNQSQKDTFIRIFKGFVAHNSLTKVILSKDVNINLFVKSIDETSDIAELDDLIQIVVNDNPDLTSFAKKYVRDIWKILHS